MLRIKARKLKNKCLDRLCGENWDMKGTIDLRVKKPVFNNETGYVQMPISNGNHYNTVKVKGE